MSGMRIFQPTYCRTRLGKSHDIHQHISSMNDLPPSWTDMVSQLGMTSMELFLPSSQDKMLWTKATELPWKPPRTFNVWQNLAKKINVSMLSTPAKVMSIC